jgi:hypothetical protein
MEHGGALRGAVGRRCHPLRVPTPTDAELEARLARPPAVPIDPDRFTSNALLDRPGIYPDGAPMVPAPGPPMDDAAVVHELARLRPQAVAVFSAAPLVARAPEPGVRAALALLDGTAGAVALDAFTRGAGPVESLRFGKTAAPGRIVGPPHQPQAAGERCVSTRYRAEHFALVTPSLVHDLLWSGPGAGHAEETTLHALVALTHVQLLARHPELGDLRTELARRQHSLAITFLNSRHPGEARISVVAPDGPGTIPGGAPALQTPDFWSVPFGPTAEDGAPVPRTVLATLVALGDPAAPPPPGRYTDALGAWLAEHLDRRALSLHDQHAAAVAIGLIAPTGA